MSKKTHYNSRICNGKNCEWVSDKEFWHSPDCSMNQPKDNKTLQEDLDRVIARLRARDQDLSYVLNQLETYKTENADLKERAKHLVEGQELYAERIYQQGVHIGKLNIKLEARDELIDRLRTERRALENELRDMCPQCRATNGKHKMDCGNNHA